MRMTGKSKAPVINEVSMHKIQTTPYRRPKEDPKFDQIRCLIENLPPDKMGLLEKCIQRWSRSDQRNLFRSGSSF